MSESKAEYQAAADEGALGALRAEVKRLTDENEPLQAHIAKLQSDLAQERALRRQESYAYLLLEASRQGMVLQVNAKP